MKAIIKSELAPAPLGPYSQAVSSEQLVFCSGQIAIDPQSGQMVKGDIFEETRRVLENLREVLHAAGCHMDDVVRCGIFLVDLQDFSAVNEVYRGYFEVDPPARTTVQVAALPRGARVEIEAIAVKPAGRSSATKTRRKVAKATGKKASKRKVAARVTRKSKRK